MWPYDSGRIDVELVTVADSGIEQEYACKRYGMQNGTTSNGMELKIKPDSSKNGGQKNALAAVAALFPCNICGTSAEHRLARVQFQKGSKSQLCDHKTDLLSLRMCHVQSV